MRFLQTASPALAGVLASTMLLSACAVAPPPGPSILAQPGKGKTMQQFETDDQHCRQFAAQANGGVTPAEAANRAGVGSAVAGTLLGAAAGALLGTAFHNPGAGAAFGAGGGLLVGSSAGAANGQRSAAAFQQNYDTAYGQCMIASGDTIVQPARYQGPPPGYGYGGGGYGGGGYGDGGYPPPPPPPPPPGYGY
ncbi:glycine zipper family protein [Lichenicola sp.]|uniref:glycine zipper family protein n=1 Tax=Lichenicola sp. TaxID=2804529 RepID=UPI003AFFD934